MPIVNSRWRGWVEKCEAKHALAEQLIFAILKIIALEARNQAKLLLLSFYES